MQSKSGPKTTAHQEHLDRPNDEDNKPVQITVRQAKKIAAVMREAARSSPDYSDMLKAADSFLSTAAEEAIDSVVSSSSSDLWDEVDAFPWPTRNLD